MDADRIVLGLENELVGRTVGRNAMHARAGEALKPSWLWSRPDIALPSTVGERRRDGLAQFPGQLPKLWNQRGKARTNGWRL